MVSYVPFGTAMKHGKYTEHINGVLYYADRYIILGEDHSSKVMISKYSASHLLRYLELIKFLAVSFGIYFEGAEAKPPPQGGVLPFITKHKLKGKWHSWEPEGSIKQTKQEHLLLMTLGCCFEEYCTLLEAPGGNKVLQMSVIERFSEKSSKWMKRNVPIKEYVNLINLSNDKELIRLANEPFSKKNLQWFNEYGMCVAFNDDGLHGNNSLYKIQESINTKRGHHLRDFAKKHGGVYFVGASHIEVEYLRKYGML
jgi:hypothetical protein